MLSKRCFFESLICLGRTITHGTAAGRLFAHTTLQSVPGWIQSRIFLRSDASRLCFGYMCWDFRFDVVVGRRLVGTIWRDLFRTTATTSPSPSAEGGYWLYTIFVGQRQGGLDVICDDCRLPRHIAGNEEIKRKKLHRYHCAPVAGLEGRICDLPLRMVETLRSRQDLLCGIWVHLPILQTGAEEPLPLRGTRKDAGSERSCASRYISKVINN